MDLFKWTAEKKKKMNRDLERRDGSMVNVVHRGSQRKKRGEVVAKIKGWNTPPPKQPKKLNSFLKKWHTATSAGYFSPYTFTLNMINKGTHTGGRRGRRRRRKMTTKSTVL